MDDTLNIENILSEDSGTPRVKQLYIALIKHSIIRSQGNRTKAAEYVGISIRTLRNQISANEELRELVERIDDEKAHRRVYVDESDEEIFLDIEKFREVSENLVKKTIKNIYKAVYVYHIRGMFNCQRILFSNERVQKATFNKLAKFDREICSLTRSSSEDLREDIEIFIENGCPIENNFSKYDSQGNYHTISPEW